MLYDHQGRPVTVTVKTAEGAELAKVEIPFKPSRQMIREYIRKCAISYINQKFKGTKNHKERTTLATTLSKDPTFIEGVRNATQAW